MPQPIYVLTTCLLVLFIGCAAPEPQPTPAAAIPSPSSQPSLAPSSPTPSPTVTSAATTEATTAPIATTAVTDLGRVATPTTRALPSPALLACPVPPTGSFNVIWKSDQTIQTALGCPNSYHPRIVPTVWEVKTSYQPFERGSMIWSDHLGWYAQPSIFVLYSDSTYHLYTDTFDPSVDSGGSGATPPAGLVAPTLGFGKVWRNELSVRDAIGWATAAEMPGSGRFALFTGGYMLWIDQTGKTYVFAEIQGANVVRAFDIPFSEK